MASSSILHFSFYVGEAAGVEEAVVVDDGSEERRMADVRVERR